MSLFKSISMKWTVELANVSALSRGALPPGFIRSSVTESVFHWTCTISLASITTEKLEVIIYKILI